MLDINFTARLGTWKKVCTRIEKRQNYEIEENEEIDENKKTSKRKKVWKGEVKKERKAKHKKIL